MNWEVRVGKSAKKKLQRFPQKDQDRVLSALDEFIFNPYAGDIEKIEGEENTWRRRIGSYRIIYEIDLAVCQFS